MSEFGIAPWEVQPGETAKAYAAFLVYRNLSAVERSVPKAAQQMDKDASLLQKWCTKYRWVGRALAYDSEQDRQRAIRSRRDIESMQERQADIGQLMQAKGVQRLRNMTDAEIALLAPWEAIRLIEAGARLEREARGESTLGSVSVLQPVAYEQPLSALLRRNPERIGPVIDALARLRTLVPELLPKNVTPVDDDEDEDGVA